MKTIKLSKRIYGKGQRNSYTPTLVNWNNVCHAGYESEYVKAEPPFNSVKSEDWNKFTTIHMMNGKTIKVKESLDTIMRKLNPNATHSVFESCDDRSALSPRQQRLADNAASGLTNAKTSAKGGI